VRDAAALPAPRAGREWRLAVRRLSRNSLSVVGLGILVVWTRAAATAPWATSELINILEKRHLAERHGIYYLMNFNS
jgi:hypothetical protein